MRVSKKIILTLLVVIVMCSVYLIHKTYNNKNVLNSEQEEPKREKMAIKVENDNGEYVYASSFPGAGYIINNDMTECVDQAGNTVDGVSFSSDGTSVTVTSKYTAYCTLYFKKSWSLGTYCDGQANMGTCMANKKSTIGKVNNMTSSEVGGMYRYQGTDNVNNWICFGTTDKSKCTQGGVNYGDGINKYMYRIIGVTSNGQLALIKEIGVNEGTTNKFVWNDKYRLETSACGADGSKCTWVNSKIYNRLNGLCQEDNPNCSGTGEGREGQTNIFINSTYYDYLSSESTWESKINIHTWKYGDVNQYDTSTLPYDGDILYSIENAFTDTKEAKIGLQYIHDYYYAYPNGKPGDMETAMKGWIFLRKDYYLSGIEWLISKSGFGTVSTTAWNISTNGNLYLNGHLNDKNIVRPVFYLKPDVKISNTAGSKTDPFIITN